MKKETTIIGRFIGLMLMLWPIAADAQIKIGGNVYGGGNHAEVRGSTKVTVKAGDIGAVMDPNATRPLDDPQGRVFGGARMANIGGSSFVHIDGESDLEGDLATKSNYILVNQVFGGNDIAGQIGTAKAVGEDIPAELTAVKRTETDKNNPKKNAVDNTFNSYVRISTKVLMNGNDTVKYSQDEVTAASVDPDAAAYGKTPDVDAKPDPNARKVYIGQLFAGGNGDFTYTDEDGNPLKDGDDYIIKQGDNIIARSAKTFVLPELDKTYLEINGGSIVYGYGGGNNATVNGQNIIHFDNPSAVVNHIKVDASGAVDEDGTDLLSDERFLEMGINLGFSQPSSGAYQVGRFFGGNNKAEMSIRPTWNLLAGKVRNLYSGGNRGTMTSPEGLLIDIKDYSSLIVDNLYGGCRMADVKPIVNGKYTPCVNLPGYYFPDELSARVLVGGGHINNVYGGNDVTGTVYGGNAVGIHTTVYGNVYGGGNGAYPYTDNEYLQNDPTYGDFYYVGGDNTMQSLKDFRPNAEQVSLHLWGESATKPTVIHGSVFVGGNCASLSVKKSQPMVELKIGSHVIADNVYLGNNGEGMIDKSYLEKFKEDGFNGWTLTDHVEFAQYMEGVAMTLLPSIVFDTKTNDVDRNEYIDYSSFIGSLFCGGNVGSMAIPGKMTFNIDRGLNIYNKFVGGCNNADVAETDLNAYYEGGIIGSEEERAAGELFTDDTGNIKDRLEINFHNMTVVPMRWNNTFEPIDATDIKNGKLIEGKEYYTSNLQDTKFIADGTEEVDLEAADKYYKMTVVGTDFEWNTVKWSYEENEYKKNIELDDSTRLINGNIYGGCYNSGHVNGNIVININDDVLMKDEIFGTGKSAFLGYEKSGVEFLDQRDDVMAVALSVFGAGHGEKTEVWGSTTTNLNNGYALQIFGGGEQGVVGKRKYDDEGKPDADDEGNYSYEFDSRFSTTVNLNGIEPIYSKEGTSENLAEAEYLYAGGNEGLVAGNTLVNLGNGRIYDAFGGSSDADILGHSEVYIGRQPDGNGGYKDGFPWINDIVYGGNDFGGTIYGAYDENSTDLETRLKARLRDYETDKTQIHGYKAGEIPEVLKSSSYVEYLQGRVDSIFGGGYGAYDYTNTALYGNASMPEQHSSYVNIRPKNHAQNVLKAVFGGGTGYPGNRDDDKAHDRSYILVDIPDGMENFSTMEVFGAGSYNGMGMRFHMDADGNTVDDDDKPISSLDEASAIIDLLRGHIHNAYGGSYQEGVTRRTVVNVPTNSSIKIDSIFGGAYGRYILPPCDVYETQVNYNNTSGNAQTAAIFGGNNKERRSLFTQVNISSPVYSNKAKGNTGVVYGAGKGIDTWSEHTEVNLNKGARVYKAYGGGEMGHVLNSASVQAYMNLYTGKPSPQISEQDPKWSNSERWTGAVGESELKSNYVEEWKKDWKTAWTLGSYYEPGVSNGETSETAFTQYATNTATNLDHFSDRAELNDKTASQLDGRKKHNTNVIINKGAVVEGYAYGGGLGDVKTYLSGDIYGSTYVAVLGGEVNRDVYAGGEAGGLDNLFGAEEFSVSSNKFVASANAYIQGGTVRNVYGGGYKGHVGHHTGDITETIVGDRPAEAYVAIGKAGDNTYEGGAPAITRNVYGGGEGGSIYGSSNVTINNGYIGYRYKNTGTAENPNYEYVEELDDQKPGDLELSGNVFGGGYVINSFVDSTTINMYGGTVRGSLYGGGEIGPIGRGTMKSVTKPDWAIKNQDATIFRAGTTNVNIFDGYVKRNVFGGGRGKDSWGGDGTMYMDPALVATLDMKCKGYVFGQTHVNIHGGEIGTNEGMAYGYGNVFGGGDEGTVYSAYTNKKNVLSIGKKEGERYDNANEGYYYRWNGSSYIDKEGNTSATRILTEDCKVVVEPYAQAYVDIKVGGNSYKAGDYVTTSDLNTLQGKKKDGTWGSPEWGSLDPRGIIIHNAVFAGGNIAAGSSSQNANDKTVYGNATASIHDVYNRDLITIGTGHTGGLYGDGNLTFVDGYRELNITNYGTDYSHIAHQLSYDQYKELPAREQAYYELKYKCLKQCVDIDGTTFSEGSNLPMDELLAQFTNPDGTSVKDGDVDIIIAVEGKKVPNPAYWEENGVVSIYAGRIMNTIQRADFCGVFGSRMVMKGAQDRVPEEADYTNYTINRVREVSLNKKTSIAGDTDDDNKEHGNYFGIYSVVNYLGALTSDVTFDKVRKTENKNTDKYKSDITVDGHTYKYGEDGASYYNWKRAHIGDRTRNNGGCHNQLALASGVYLELTSEEKTGKTVDTKEWGPITGVVELDLINVQPGMGGGFVYAKNIHGVRSKTNDPNTTLTTLNTGAASKKDYTYDTTDAAYDSGTQKGQYQWETSGNFIHSTQTIIDDCYNISNRYYGSDKVLAHYWYIAGSVYVYDQYLSAYTGSPNAFSETVEIPISISAASNGTMTLLDVQPNYYAYYKDASTNTPLSGDQKLVINDVTYQLNDAISYWDWKKLTSAQQKLFVSDTYVTSAGCKIGNDTIYAGTVMILGASDKPGTYEAYKAAASSKTIDEKEVKVVTSNGKEVPFDEVFHSSNNMSHNTGFLLTYNVNNPGVWDKWYTKKESSTREKAQDKKDDTNYESGPTYHPETAGLYGQQEYDINAIIPNTIRDAYEALGNNKPTSDDQAEFKPAYLVTEECTSSGQHYYPGAPVSIQISGCTAPAYVSTATMQLSPTEYIYVNDLMTLEQKNKYKNDYSSLANDIEELIKPAYICTTAGKYGGSYYETGKNYRALEAYSAMSEEDRKKFNFNYDALDLLIDPSYSGEQGRKYQYDGKDYTTAEDAAQNEATYSLATPIDYTATYNGATDEIAHNGITLTNGEEYPRAEFENLPNEQHHYAPIAVAAAGGTYYVVKESFIHGDEAYAVGTTIGDDTYASLTDHEQQTNIASLTFDSASEDKTYYYCREEYMIGEKTEGVKPTVVTGITGTDESAGIETRKGKEWVKVGTIINAESNGDNKGYEALPNYQKNFTIHGVSPMETSTLYVSRNADINDLSTEKIITVIYKYDYEESDESGLHITPVTERHVVNIHVNFKSGVPTVEDINPPTIVLPGTGITMRVPSVTPGAYEITGGGWEIFENTDDAESHINGVPYTPSVDPLYWYQDGFYLAYYAKTYLGKTYSNHVPVSVANYHDLKRVMEDKTTHLYVDYDRTRLKRDSKIYINDYSESSQNGLDLFKNFYDLSILEKPSTDPTTGLINAGEFIGHKPLNNSTETGTNKYDKDVTNVRGVKAGTNLDFILRTDINHTGEWSSVGETQCFNGSFHGDGHTISGLNKSLFNKLCGNVYNLGVTGSFTGAGVAETGDGYVENCWISTSSTAAKTSKPVFAAPTNSGDYKQIVNSYYMEEDNATNKYPTHDGTYGKPTRKTAQAFYNGEVAYDLNGFYLYKRYNDGVHTASGVDYNYYTLDASGNIVNKETPLTGYYANNMDQALCSSGYNNIKYVEERYADGDFVFAAGEIPTAEEERHWIDKEHDNKSYYFPIWPDDYIFFGQKLTYGWAAENHQNVPTAVVREDGRLSTSTKANRVYRAPAYYRSKDMGMTHFNPHVYLAQQEKLTDEQIEANEAQIAAGHPENVVTPRDAYPHMTAIDFKGHNDLGYQLGLKNGKFYTPLLDDDGLLSIQNCDETQNIIAYAPEADTNAKTYGVLNSYFTEPAYSDHYQKDDSYRLVTEASAASVHGHLVHFVDGEKKATNDHLLVDYQDFNAPISYSFDSDHLMWYQRLPRDKEYVDLTKGWQGISIPFTAELVTTNQKGEITHFFDGSTTGHEYWLRALEAGSNMTLKENDILGASFKYPTGSNVFKNATNTFLWEYYYKNTNVHNQKDRNKDKYEQDRTYYENPRRYDGYPLLTAAIPYILGLPGETYYEFDLSGKFEAQNTDVNIPKLGKQIITFASNKGVGIGVSDGEMDGTKVKYNSNSYTFKPSYMNMSLAANTGSYILNAEGKSFDLVPTTGDATPVAAFRPYFVSSEGGSNGSRSFFAKKIVFGDAEGGFGEGPETVLDGSLEIYTRGYRIFTTSHMKEATTIRIVNAAGATITNYLLQPGETIETPVAVSGVYVVNKKKVFVEEK